MPWHWDKTKLDDEVCLCFNYITGECGGVVVKHQTLNHEVLGSVPNGATMLCP